MPRMKRTGDGRRCTVIPCCDARRQISFSALTALFVNEGLVHPMRPSVATTTSFAPMSGIFDNTSSSIASFCLTMRVLFVLGEYQLRSGNQLNACVMSTVTWRD